MCKLFAEDSVEMLKTEQITKKVLYVVAYGTTILANLPGWTVSSHNHLEADTLLICIINNVVELWRQTTQTNRLSVRLISPDTDVLMLALNFVARSDRAV